MEHCKGVKRAVIEMFGNRFAVAPNASIWYVPAKEETPNKPSNYEEGVAVIMPVCNSKGTLLNTVNSILNQSHKNLTLIAVDDYSTDGSLEWLQEYSKREPRIKILRSDSKSNPAGARNTALRCLGEMTDIKHIAYCDSDDLWDINHLKGSIEFLKSNNSDMVYSDAKFISPSGGVLSSLAPYHKDFNRDILLAGNFIYISSVVHKKECASIGLFDEAVPPLEDWDYWIRIASKYNVIHRQVESITYLCRENGYTGSDDKTTESLNKIKSKVASFELLSPKKDNKKKPAVYDCFPFYNELDVLEIRLAELYDVVDRFVIVEATKTHQNNPKPLYLKDNLDRFKKYLHKISHVVVDDYPATDSWSIERHQRDGIMRALGHCSDEDIIIISDCDEIPKPDKIKKYDKIMGFGQKLYYYNFNCQAEDLWCEARILSYGELKKLTPCGARYTKCEVIPDGGWHFSYLKDVNGIIEKLHSTAHAEYNKPEYTDKQRIETAIKENKDLFGRDLKYKYVEIDDSYPKFVLNNLDYFSQKGFIVRSGSEERKIVIVMTYFERFVQLTKTLNSLEKSKYKNFEVVIVDDASEPMLFSATSDFSFKISVINISKNDKSWHHPAIIINQGVEKALTLNPDIIILQCAECFHVGDILSYTNKNLSDSNYLSFACYSIDEKNTFDERIDEKLDGIIKATNADISKEGQNGWYNHSAIRPVGWDFCSAITTGNMIKVNGYDERYASGVAHGDRDYLRRIKKSGLKLSIIDSPFVVHQWHYNGANMYDKTELVKRNEELYDIASNEEGFKAKHIVTTDFDRNNNKK